MYAYKKKILENNPYSKSKKIF